jgi:2-polyprenyl-6-methoxyphenol hydroxylase-like FAD-dependent oxidoreductase
MPQNRNDTDVLIAGAGPVGLFLANECARRGLRHRIVETRATQSEHSKALAIFPRTLEIFDMAGVVAPFLAEANRATSVAVIAHGRSLAQMPFAPEHTPYPFIAMVPQDATERLLAERLQQRGGSIDYNTTLVGAAACDDHVHVTLEHDGQRSELDAAFVIGCDGAHSAVRHLLNLSFEGAEYRDLFLLADIETNDTLPADQLQLCPHELGPVAIFPMSATRRRVVAMIREPQGDAPSLDLVREILAQRAPAGIEARALHWSSYFHIHHRHVAQMRSGLMFVAGDAAHIHSPFGGQGMNTGLQDAWNLAWKLDLVLQGRGSEALLDSYDAERLPVIRNVIATTDFMTKALGTPSKLAQLLRNAVIPMVSRLAPFQHAFVQRLSELDVGYRGSPIVDGSGARWFDESLRGGDGIRSRYLLMIGSDVAPPTIEAARQFAGTFPGLVDWRMSQQPGLALIRPDGYIACSGHARDGPAILASAGELLQRQVA